MSQEETQEDNFTMIEKNNREYFAEIENSVPHFQQELFELQNEFYKAWNSNANIFADWSKNILQYWTLVFTSKPR